MVEYRLNSAEHSSTGYAPCTLIYDTQSVEELQLMSKTALRSTNNFDSYLKELDYNFKVLRDACLLYTSPSPRDVEESRMPSSA